MVWRIYYGDGRIVEGNTKTDWTRAPKTNVQVVVSLQPQDPPRWHYVNAQGKTIPVRDRQLWTGVDTYDPFGYGAKTGLLISLPVYEEIWNKACADSIT